MYQLTGELTTTKTEGEDRKKPAAGKHKGSLQKAIIASLLAKPYLRKWRKGLIHFKSNTTKRERKGGKDIGGKGELPGGRKRGGK